MKAACDSEFLIFLAKLSLLNKFLELYKTYITNIVKEEILVEGKPGYFELLEAINKGRIKVVEVKKNAYFNLMITNGIDEGEASAIVLAKEINAIFFSDDKRARKTAEKYNIKVKGVLGLILELYKRNIISKEQAYDYLEKLEKIGFRIKRELIEKIKNVLT